MGPWCACYRRAEHPVCSVRRAGPRVSGSKPIHQLSPISLVSSAFPSLLGRISVFPRACSSGVSMCLWSPPSPLWRAGNSPIYTKFESTNYMIDTVTLENNFLSDSPTRLFTGRCYIFISLSTALVVVFATWQEWRSPRGVKHLREPLHGSDTYLQQELPLPSFCGFAQHFSLIINTQLVSLCCLG